MNRTDSGPFRRQCREQQNHARLDFAGQGMCALVIGGDDTLAIPMEPPGPGNWVLDFLNANPPTCED